MSPYKLLVVLDLSCCCCLYCCTCSVSSSIRAAHDLLRDRVKLEGMRHSFYMIWMVRIPWAGLADGHGYASPVITGLCIPVHSCALPVHPACAGSPVNTARIMAHYIEGIARLARVHLHNRVDRAAGEAWSLSAGGSAIIV